MASEDAGRHPLARPSADGVGSVRSKQRSCTDRHTDAPPPGQSTMPQVLRQCAKMLNDRAGVLAQVSGRPTSIEPRHSASARSAIVASRQVARASETSADTRARPNRRTCQPHPRSKHYVELDPSQPWVWSPLPPARIKWGLPPSSVSAAVSAASCGATTPNVSTP